MRFSLLKRLVTSAFVLFLVTSPSRGSVHDEFFTSTSDTKYIWPTIPFILGADLQAFKEAYGRSRGVLRWEAIEQALSLMNAGAYGAESLEIVLAFDHQITKNRWRSQQRVPVALEGFFNARLDALYNYYRPQNRFLTFRHTTSPIEIIGDASSNMRPGRIDSSALKKLDYIVYGSFSTSERAKAQWNIFLYVVNVKNGVTRILKGEGDTQSAADSVADQLFKLFQGTTFPSKIKYGRGKTLTVLTSDVIDSYAAVRLDHSYKLATWACDDLNGRLPTERELAIIDRAGDYGGGVTLNAKFQDHYYWALSNDQIYALTMRKSFSPNQLNPSRWLRYLCVD
ncbi:MAG: hypothetical protein KDD61_05900 [Bdellovibrionales bacterium]|nr:hypothetical protein [Bdellovibrionales bacterium]